MPSFYEKPLFRYPIYALIALSIIIILISIYFNWLIGAIGVVLLAVILFFIKRADSLIRKEIDDYISTLSYRLKKVGEEALMEMPIGIMLFNDQYYIEWANPFLSSCFNESTLVGRSLYDTCEAVVPLIKQEVDSETITLNERKFKVVIKRDERLLYFFDVTEQIQIEKQYENERTVLAYIFLDNYDDVTQGLDDQTRSTMNSQVTSLLNAWAQEYGIFLKRTSSERFIAVLNEHILTELENAKFSILDEIRENSRSHCIFDSQHRDRRIGFFLEGAWRSGAVQPGFGSRPRRRPSGDQNAERQGEILRRQNESDGEAHKGARPGDFPRAQGNCLRKQQCHYYGAQIS